MYLAKMSDPLCGAKYFYKTKSIYLNADLPLSDATSYALHECIHYLQEIVDKNGELLRLGLYDFVGNCGVALNEGAVQLMASEALGNKKQDVTYYQLHLSTISPDYYPLECAIVRQMSYFTGTYPLYHSTLHGNDVFKNTFIAIAGEKTFYQIQASLDRIAEESDRISYFSHCLACEEDRPKYAEKWREKIEESKQKIMNLFISSQDLMISECFSRELNNIRSLNDIKSLKDKLYGFSNYIATTDDYTFYNDFYRTTMECLEEKAAYIQEHGAFDLRTPLTTDLTVISTARTGWTLFRRLLKKLGLLGQTDE